MMQHTDKRVRSYVMHLDNAIVRIKNFPGQLGTHAQIEELCRDQFFERVHDGTSSEFHHLISDVPAAKKPKFFKLVEAAVKSRRMHLLNKEESQAYKRCQGYYLHTQNPLETQVLSSKTCGYRTGTP